jgi:hypothetical protein
MKFATSDRSGSAWRSTADRHFERYGIVGQSRAVTDVIRRIELVSATAARY